MALVPTGMDQRAGYVLLPGFPGRSPKFSLNVREDQDPESQGGMEAPKKGKGGKSDRTSLQSRVWTSPPVSAEFQYVLLGYGGNSTSRAGQVCIIISVQNAACCVYGECSAFVSYAGLMDDVAEQHTLLPFAVS